MQIVGSNSVSRGTIAVLGGSDARTERIRLRRLLWVGPVTVMAAVAATLAAWAIAVAVLPPVNPAFVELQAQSIAFVTSVLCAAAVAVFSLVALLSRRPLQTFRVVAAIALVLSWLPDLPLLSAPVASVGDVIALMLLHVVAAAAVVWTLSMLTREA